MSSQARSKKAVRFSPKENSASSIGLRLGLGLLISLFMAWVVGVTWSATASPAPQGAAARAPGTPPSGYGPSSMSGFPDLVAGLKATPGCVGVETAITGAGKRAIFAWFRDKKAVLAWYNSDMHRKAQDRFFPNRPPHKPLEYVAEDIGPMMVVASITLADSSQFAVTKMPISQIAIELYAPQPGGLSLGGRFAPESLVVPHLIDLGRKPGQGVAPK